ncbi:hypothetical protein CBR_g20118 [Chara braunii]|uniref:Uncharacterized protein n=1 Tax=Chara braunii TaxID=69332 RepID=A0A388KZK0_CHABU|nr:hypothetical protein CBR_g20118 [Chara braunii]|eukprot:GBG75487.1 hypothetical protein CBR_g20118 [Chara braunii]
MTPMSPAMNLTLSRTGVRLPATQLQHPGHASATQPAIFSRCCLRPVKEGESKRRQAHATLISRVCAGEVNQCRRTICSRSDGLGGGSSSSFPSPRAACGDLRSYSPAIQIAASHFATGKDGRAPGECQPSQVQLWCLSMCRHNCSSSRSARVLAATAGSGSEAMAFPPPDGDAHSSAAGSEAPSSSSFTGSVGETEESRRRNQGLGALFASLKSKMTSWQANAAAVRAQVAKLGLAAVLAYGLIDGIMYTIFFIIAFLGYEKSTGQNPARNLKALLAVVIIMWTGNNFTRPFRLAGAAALAPVFDKGIKKLQKALNLPNEAAAFALATATIAGVCLTIAGALILSRFVA